MFIRKENDELLLLCDRPYKLMRFSLDGEFIRETVHSELYREIAAGSDGLFCTLFENIDQFEIGCFDREFELVHRALATRKELVDNYCYGGGKSLVKSKNVIYARRFDPSLYYLSGGSIEKRYELDLGKYHFPPTIPCETDCAKLFQLCRTNKYIYTITNPVESEKFILFSTNIGNCLYEKETNKLTGFSIIFNSSLKYGNSNYYPNDGDGNSIIVSFDPASLSYYNEKTIKDSSLFSDLVKNVKPDDNPILFVYEFKK